MKLYCTKILHYLHFEIKTNLQQAGVEYHLKKLFVMDRDLAVHVGVELTKSCR